MSSGIENSIAIDSNDNIHISYYNSANGLNYATDYTGNLGHIYLILPVSLRPVTLIFAIDSGDNIHILHSQSTGVLQDSLCNG